MTKYSLNTLWCYKYLDQSPASRAGMTEPCFGWQRRGSELGIVCSPAVLNFHSSETRSWESNVPSPFTPLSVNFSRIDPIFTHSMSFSSEPGCSCLSCYCGLWAAAWALLRINQTWPKSLWSPEFLAQEWYLEFLEGSSKGSAQPVLFIIHTPALSAASFHPPPHCPRKGNNSFLKKSSFNWRVLCFESGNSHWISFQIRPFEETDLYFLLTEGMASELKGFFIK